MPTSWTIACSREVHASLCDELEMPYVDSIHGQHLQVSALDERDLVVLWPSAAPHVFSAEEALYLSRLDLTPSRMRRYYVPPAGLTPEQEEVYQALRADSVRPNRAYDLARLV